MNNDPSCHFLSWLFQRCEAGNLNFRFKRPDGVVIQEFLPLSLLFDDPSKVTKLIKKHRGEHSWFGVGLREGESGKKETITEIPALWVDLDEAPIDKVKESRWQSSAIIETSPGRYQVYWKLREPVTRAHIPQVENIVKRLQVNFAGDPNATDASRLLRIPGTQNVKRIPPFEVAIKLMDGAEYELSDFDDLPEVKVSEKTYEGPRAKANDRVEKILSCKFMQHCNVDRASLPEPQWYGMTSILAREPGGRDLIHSLSMGHPNYSARETDEKILHALNAGPLTCQRIKGLWDCGQNCGVTSPVRLAFKRPVDQPCLPNDFPRAGTIGGLAKEFSDLHSSYLESPWSFFAFGFLTCLGSLLADRITLESEISPQPRLYTVHLGESADDRKSESIKKTVGFFEAALAQGEFRVCHGVGSAEGLAKRLGETEEGSSKLLLVYDELKSFVGKAMIEGATLFRPSTRFLRATNSTRPQRPTQSN